VAVAKRSMFFTLISFVFVLALIAFMLPNSEYTSFSSKVPTLKVRLAKANGFMESIYGVLGERALKYSGQNSLREMVIYVNSTRKPLKNASAEFISLMMDASINGTHIDAMENNTLPLLMARFERLGRNDLDLKPIIKINGISIYQSNLTGYNRVGLDMNLSVYVDGGVASWNSTKIVSTFLYVDRFDDPYYVLNYDGFGNRIKLSNVSPDEWSPNKTWELIDSMQYTYEPGAPSFLMRFENKSAGSDCCGMESLINPVRMNISTSLNSSYVDFCYFGRVMESRCFDSIHNYYNFTTLTRGTPGAKFYAFKLEWYHTSKYNLIDDII
jgi:hypothetical protein